MTIKIAENENFTTKALLINKSAIINKKTVLSYGGPAEVVFLWHTLRGPRMAKKIASEPARSSSLLSSALNELLLKSATKNYYITKALLIPDSLYIFFS